MTGQAATIEQSFAAWQARDRFAGLDGLRAIAILAVLWHHGPYPWLPEASHLLQRGFLGVDLFFVLSGFLITTLLLRERARRGTVSLRAFYWRRALRILPVYLLVVTAVGAWYVVVQGRTDLAHLWPFYYLFLANFLPEHIPLLSPTWSLAVEEQFYLLWPLLLVLLPPRALLPVLVASVAVNVAGALGLFGGPVLFGPLVLALPPPTYAPILLGAALAVVLDAPRGYAALQPLARPMAAPLSLVVVLALIWLLPADLRGWPNMALHLTFCALLAAIVMTPHGALTRALGWGPLARLGVVSYGVYLYHLIVLHGANGVLGRIGLDHPALVLLLYALASWAVAEVSFRTFEAWFTRLRHRGPGAAVAAPGLAIARGQR